MGGGVSGSKRKRKKKSVKKKKDMKRNSAPTVLNEAIPEPTPASTDVIFQMEDIDINSMEQNSTPPHSIIKVTIKYCSYVLSPFH